MTALYAEDPQSHRAQASTVRRLIRALTASCVGNAAASAAPSPSVIAPRSVGFGCLLFGPQTARDQHFLQYVDPVGEDTVDTGIDEPFHSFGVIHGPDLHLLAGS